MEYSTDILMAAITNAYDKGYQKGRLDREGEISDAAKRKKAYYAGLRDVNTASQAFNDMLLNNEMQAEFDRRVGKALDKARSNWEESHREVAGGDSGNE